MREIQQKSRAGRYQFKMREFDWVNEKELQTAHERSKKMSRRRPLQRRPVIEVATRRDVEMLAQVTEIYNTKPPEKP